MRTFCYSSVPVLMPFLSSYAQAKGGTCVNLLVLPGSPRTLLSNILLKGILYGCWPGQLCFSAAEGYVCIVPLQANSYKESAGSNMAWFVWLVRSLPTHTYHQCVQLLNKPTLMPRLIDTFVLTTEHGHGQTTMNQRTSIWSTEMNSTFIPSTLSSLLFSLLSSTASKTRRATISSCQAQASEN